MEKQNNSWIKELYQRSWEMELLISGFVLVFLLQSWGYISKFFRWVDYVVPETYPNIYLIATYVVSLLSLSVLVLIVFLVLNLIFRAYWIALIGLVSRVNKHSGIHRFSANRKQNVRQVKQMRATFSHIDDVDKWGSQLFSIGLLFLFMVASTTLCFIWFLTLGVLFSNESVNAFLQTGISFIYFVGMVLFLFDLYSGGVVSRIKIKVVNVPFFYIHLFFRYISFYFLYEKIALNAKGNGQVKAINITLFILVIWVAGIKTIENSRNVFELDRGIKNNNRTMFSHKINYLDELKSRGHINNIVIDKRLYHHMPIRVFIPLTATIAAYIKEGCPKNETTGKIADTSCLDKIYSLRVNEQDLSVRWHLDTNIETATKGVSAYIDLPTLARGEHQFQVTASYLEAPLTKTFWYYPK